METTLSRETAKPGMFVKTYHTPYGTTVRKYLGLGTIRTVGRFSAYVWVGEKLFQVDFDSLEAV